jgi:MFS family permease
MRTQGRWVVAAMILGSSVAGIDSTAVAVALPAIGRNLHAGFQGLQWTVTSYTLTLASLILLAGSLSGRWGRRVFLAGLTLRGRVAAGGRQLAVDLPDQRPRWPRRCQPDKRPLLCRDAPTPSRPG